ncbi:ABC transporter permease [Arthrobacter pigmenti]
MSEVNTRVAGAAGDSTPARRRPHFILRHKMASCGAVLLALLVGAAVFAPAITGFDPLAVNPVNRLAPPSPDHWFGTDNLGRDVFSRVIYGGRASLGVGALVVLVAVGGGTLLGLICGYYRWADVVLMRFVDGLMSFPGLVLAIALIGVLGPGIIPVVIALSLVYAPRVTRIVRGSALVIKDQPMIEASRQIGASSLYIVARHVTPHCLSPIIVQASFIFAYAVLGEAALSFLGVGVPPSTPTWGNVLTESRTYLQQAWWMAIFPGLFIIASVLALNLVGDALRDYFDPKLRQRRS